MKPEGKMDQAVTQVNVLSLEIFNIVEEQYKVDTLHNSGRQQICNRQRRGGRKSTGVLGNSMMQDACYVNLGDPLNSKSEKLMRYVETSWEQQGSTNDLVEVGLTGSTRSAGKPHTWGSGQQQCNSFRPDLTVTRRTECEK